MTTRDGPKSAYRRVQDRVSVVNKWVLNPAMLRIAGRRFVPTGVVRHVGRRSGRTYDTPVLVGTAGDSFLIPLPYGADVDWARNVLAADGCTVAWQGTAYPATSPELVDPATGREAFPGWFARLVELAGADQYLRLERGAADPERYRDLRDAHPVAPVVVVAGALAFVAAVMLAGGGPGTESGSGAGSGAHRE